MPITKLTNNHIEKFEEGQIWILINGDIVCIKEVTPCTKIHSSDDDRSIEYFRVKKADKKLSSETIMVESLRNKCIYEVVIGEVFSTNYKKLNESAAFYVGKIIPERMDIIRRAYNDIIS